LARQVAATPGLRFEGLMGYEGHTLMMADKAEKKAAIVAAIGKLIRARDLVKVNGQECKIVSAGGSGSYQLTADIAGITEIQAGGGIFGCQYYTQACRVSGHHSAVSVLATVVSRPSADRAILDIGLKSVSQHQTLPVLRDYPECRVIGLSAEHAKIALGPETVLQIGEKVHVIPGYSDFTFVLHDRVIGLRGGRVEAVWDLLGRGCLQ
jgi:D-serine deaminase-like pyridoxal phosphate-dependent protein